jgi:pyruvate/2-oxoglutarate dehydrogenase complex dihydrolipoamide dehydrogenase (E3) component
MSSSSTQLVVIGAGPGGYAAAFYAADLGMQVTLVDPSVNPGGVCLYRGCIPSKALLHDADVVNEAKHAEAWGVTLMPIFAIAPLAAASKYSDAWSSALDGMQPTLTQVPPSVLSISTQTVERPSCAARMAAT